MQIVLEGNDQTILDTLTGVYGDITGLLNSTLGEVENYVTDIYGTASEYFETGYESMKTFLGDTWDGVVETYQEYNELFDGVIDGLSKEVNDSLFWVASTTNRAFDDMGVIVTDIFHNSNKYMDESVDAVSKVMETTIDETGLFFTNLFESVKNWVNSIANVSDDEMEEYYIKSIQAQRNIASRLVKGKL